MVSALCILVVDIECAFILLCVIPTHKQMPSPSTKDLQRTQVFIPVQMIAWLKERAKTEGVSYAELVRRALDLYREFKDSEQEDIRQAMAGAYEGIVESYEEEESEVLNRLESLEHSLARIEKRLNAII